MKKFFIETVQRLKTGTGPYWKKIQLMAASFGTIGLSFQAIPDLAKAGTYIIEAGVIIAAIAQLTKADKPTEETKNK